MKAVVFSVLSFLFATTLVFAQDKPASPHEKISQTVNGKTITIDYGRPYVKGRDVWNATGSLAPYGKVWRTGADSATSFRVDKDIMVEGQKLPAGRYAMFTIPGENEWTVIFSKNWKQWGAYTYKEDEDVLRVKVPAKKSSSPTEQFTIDIAKNGTVAMKWASAEADFKVQ